MENPRHLELYEKLYFHEVDAREKISARLQIPLAILLSIVSLYAFFLKGISLKHISEWRLLFGIPFLISLFLFGLSSYNFIRSFYGHTYEFIPSAKDSEEYRLLLIDTYKEFEDCDELVKKYFDSYLYGYYTDCSSANTKINDSRSRYLHRANTYIILNAPFLVILFLMFTFNGSIKETEAKELRVKLTNPAVVINSLQPSNNLDKLYSSKQLSEQATQTKAEVNNMSDNKRPAPPPPPPKRVVREDVEIPQRKANKEQLNG